MGKVVLVFPKTGWDVRGVTCALPLGILCLGSALRRAGFGVEIIDQRLDDNWMERLKGALQDKDVLWVGISSMTGHQIAGGLRASEVVKAISKVPVVWGGIHPTLLPEQCLEHPLVDMVIMGEGEKTAVELSEALEGCKDLEGISGLCFKQGHEKVINSFREPPDKIVSPDYQLLDLSPYLTYSKHAPGQKELRVLTGKGCPHDCAFCYNQAFHKKVWRGLQAEEIFFSLQELHERWGVKDFLLEEDNFFANPKRAEALCHLLKESGLSLRLRTNCRADYLARWSEEFLALLKDAGFSMFFVGIESGSQRILDMLKKGLCLEELPLVNRKLMEVGIAVKYSFMAGFPGEKQGERQSTLSLMRRLVEENPIAYTTNLQLYCPYPGTELYQRCLEAGYPFPKSLDGWAAFNWNSISSFLIDPRERKWLERASYFTFFLDGKTVKEYYVNRRWLKTLAELYTQVVRLRCKMGFYGFMPEVALLRRQG